jgi:hypothetical protein
MHTAKQHITESAEGYSLSIKLDNVKCAGVVVENITMFIAKDEDYGDGDLAANWSMEGLQNNEAARTAGTLLLRNVHSTDDVTVVMGKFYWEHAFDAQLRAELVKAGFSAEAVADVSGSEWGMQDEGRASYDAYMLGAEVRAIMQKQVA